MATRIGGSATVRLDAAAKRKKIRQLQTACNSDEVFWTGSNRDSTDWMTVYVLFWPSDFSRFQQQSAQLG